MLETSVRGRRPEVAGTWCPSPTRPPTTSSPASPPTRPGLGPAMRAAKMSGSGAMELPGATSLGPQVNGFKNIFQCIFK